VTVSQVPRRYGRIPISAPTHSHSVHRRNLRFYRFRWERRRQIHGHRELPELLCLDQPGCGRQRHSKQRTQRDVERGRFWVLRRHQRKLGRAEWWPYASYTCLAPASPTQFTVPSYILLALPSGTGTTSVENSSNVSSFTATGIDHGSAYGAVQVQVNTTYN